MNVLHTITTEELGPRRGTVLAIPGLAESAESLAVTAAHWASRGSRVHAVDPRGHGRSPRWTPELLKLHPGDVIAGELIDALDDLVDQGEPLILFGHSAGGSAAAAVAAARPDVVTAVVLEDPFWRLPVTAHQDRDVAAGAASWLRRQQRLSDAERRREAAAVHPSWPADELAGWSSSKEQMDVALVENGDVIPTRGWPTLLHDLEIRGIPVLILTGTLKIGNTPSHRAIQRAHGAAVEVLDGASHFVRRDQREIFHARVDRFLDEIVR